MIKTFFPLKFSLNQIITSKYLIQHFYNKYFISKLCFNKWKKLLFVNTYSTQILVLSKVYKSLFLIGLLNRGCSLISDYFIYKTSNLHSYLYSGLNFKLTTTKLASRFLNRLNSFFYKKEIFILYKIKRGGYFGLIRGLKGFIPSEHLFLLPGSFIVHKNCIIFNQVYNTNIFKNYFQSINFMPGGFNFNFNRTKNKRFRLFLSGKITYLYFSYSSVLHFWLKRFKLFSLLAVKNKLFLKSIIKKI